MKKGEVYMGDLEKALWYVVNKEIPAKTNLDEKQLKAVYQLLENVVRYLPLRMPLKQFLMALREWPVLMEFKTVSGDQYAEKVRKLSRKWLEALKFGYLPKN